MTQRNLDVIMPTYNLIEYSDNYSKKSGSLWQWYRDELTDSESFEFKIKITGNTPTDSNTKDVEIAVSLKYFGDFRRTLELPLINSEISLILKWSWTCVITNSAAAEIICKNWYETLRSNSNFINTK